MKPRMHTPRATLRQVWKERHLVITLLSQQAKGKFRCRILPTESRRLSIALFKKQSKKVTNLLHQTTQTKPNQTKPKAKPNQPAHPIQSVTTGAIKLHQIQRKPLLRESRKSKNRIAPCTGRIPLGRYFYIQIVHARLEMVLNFGHKIYFQWLTGHCEITCNETANKSAKRAHHHTACTNICA